MGYTIVSVNKSSPVALSQNHTIVSIENVELNAKYEKNKITFHLKNVCVRNGFKKVIPTTLFATNLSSTFSFNL